MSASRLQLPSAAVALARGGAFAVTSPVAAVS
jgi:hypothetical protein